MEEFNRYIYYALIVVSFVSCEFMYAVSSIKKVFHHKGDNGCAHIESGSCVLYFDTVPTMTPKPTKIENNKEIQTFFFPSTKIGNDECKHMIAQLNKDTSRTYTFHIAAVQKPQQGVLVTISYDPAVHTVECKQFEAITRDQGLVFYVYNKKTLDTLRSRKEPIMRMAESGKHPPVIFIDNGHGGNDTGAMGVNGMQEKEISLKVGTYVAQLLKKHGYKVVLSRSSDANIALDQRTTHANCNHADIFVSIHANAASNEKACGIETFCIKPNLFTRTHSMLDIHHKQLVDHVLTQKSEISNKLASLVQRYLCHHCSKHHIISIDRGLKHSVAQVFFAHMPAILIELGFVTNTQECQLLSSRSYQQTLAHAIVQAICDHFNNQS